jgi:hypothetical protein
LFVHIGGPSSNQATTLESQMIHMVQELFGQTLTPIRCRSIRKMPKVIKNKRTAFRRKAARQLQRNGAYETPLGDGSPKRPTHDVSLACFRLYSTFIRFS